MTKDNEIFNNEIDNATTNTNNKDKSNNDDFGIIKDIKNLFENYIKDLDNINSDDYIKLISKLEEDDDTKELELKKIEKEALYKSRKELSRYFLNLFGNIMLLDKEEISKLYFFINLLENDLKNILIINEKKYQYKKGTLIYKLKTENNYISKEEIEKESYKDNQYLYLMYNYLFIEYFLNIVSSFKFTIKSIMFNNK